MFFFNEIRNFFKRFFCADFVFSCAQIYRQKSLSKDTDIMVSADEHFNITLEVTRALAHTQPSGDDDDYQMIDYSGADVIKYSGTEKAYVRLFVFSLFLSSLFSLLSSSFIADVFLFVSLSLLGAQTYRWEVSRL